MVCSAQLLFPTQYLHEPETTYNTATLCSQPGDLYDNALPCYACSIAAAGELASNLVVTQVCHPSSVFQRNHVLMLCRRSSAAVPRPRRHTQSSIKHVMSALLRLSPLNLPRRRAQHMLLTLPGPRSHRQHQPPHTRPVPLPGSGLMCRSCWHSPSAVLCFCSEESVHLILHYVVCLFLMG